MRNINHRVGQEITVPTCKGSRSADGNTEVAGTCSSTDARRRRNAGLLVSDISKRVFTDGLSSASSEVRRIVESLVWPVVARVSLREPWFDDRSFRRLVTSVSQMATRIMKYDLPGSVAQKYVKYWCDYLLHKCMRNQEEYPISDTFGNPLFSGFLRLFVNRALARRDLAFIYSLQKGSKRMWPKLDDVCWQAALEKHRVRLSSVKERSDATIIERIRLTAQAVFRDLPKSVATKFMPSGSACVQASVKDGGALSLFRKFELVKSDCLRSLSLKLEEWRRECHREAERIVLENGTNSLHVSVQAIAEPGKYRIITLGCGYLYSALQPLQGLMLDGWKSCYASTMRDEDLTVRIQSMHERSAEDGLDLWCSVDYEAATDLLNKDATFAVLDGLKAVPGYELARFSFGRGTVRYPGKSGLEPVPGVEGQLMGHPLSFPALCVINLAVYHEAVECYVNQRTFESEERFWMKRRMKRNVIVNGDDMLFKCDAKLFEIFKRTSQSVGFKFSAGKNYLSPDCCMINSQTFIVQGDRVFRRGYLNMKLVTGQSVKSGDSTCTPTELGPALTQMIRLTPWTSCCVATAFGRFDLRRFGFRPNWCLPVHLGGFGLGDAFVRLTKEQRLVAAHFVNHVGASLYRKTGKGSRVLQRYAGAVSSVGWADYGPQPAHMTDESDEWLARLSYVARAMDGAAAVKVAPVKWRRDYRLKPMSDEAIHRYWHKRMVRHYGPTVPSLGRMRMNRWEGAYLIARSKFLTGHWTFESEKTPFDLVHRV